MIVEVVSAVRNLIMYTHMLYHSQTLTSTNLEVQQVLAFTMQVSKPLDL